MLAAVAVGCGASGCSYRLGALSGSDQHPERVERTASVAPVPAMARALHEAPTEADLVFAKAAAAEVLARGGKDASQPWENPRTGARGTVTPIASAYTQDGRTCRDFLASHVRGSEEAWYQGGACRNGDRWVVRDLRPLQRT